ncbi:hypothetical protein JTB14_007941 [Gonioctena quinquepunctata]|nr:hypothetical protein JTB14_007941 [Gonioctena quinquepunctata]
MAVLHPKPVPQCFENYIVFQFHLDLVDPQASESSNPSAYQSILSSPYRSIIQLDHRRYSSAFCKHWKKITNNRDPLRYDNVAVAIGVAGSVRGIASPFTSWGKLLNGINNSMMVIGPKLKLPGPKSAVVIGNPGHNDPV